RTHGHSRGGRWPDQLPHELSIRKSVYGYLVGLCDVVETSVASPAHERLIQFIGGILYSWKELRMPPFSSPRPLRQLPPTGRSGDRPPAWFPGKNAVGLSAWRGKCAVAW